MIELHKLGEYVSLKQGLAINKGTSYLVSDKKDDIFIYPLLRIADMMDNKYEKYVSKDVQSAVLAKEDDIIYTRTGQIGLAFRGVSGCVHNNSFIVSLTSNEITKDYLYVLLNTEFVRQQALSLAKNSVQPDLTHDMFKSILVPVPEKSIQQNISNLYLDIDEKLRLNKSICSDLEALAKEIYDYWFVQFDFPDENGNPYKSSGGKMVWNEELNREIPEDWELHKAGEFINIIRGVSYNPEDVSDTPKDNYVPLVKSNNLQNGKVDYSSPVYVPKTLVGTEQYLTNSSIFVTMSSGSTEHVGKTAIVPFNSKYCYGAFCSKIELNPKYRCLLSMFFTSDYFKRIIHTLVVGTSIKNINNVHLTDNNIILPPNTALTDVFESIINPMLDKMGEIIVENQQLMELRDFLLPLLMNGQVSVK